MLNYAVLTICSAAVLLLALVTQRESVLLLLIPLILRFGRSGEKEVGFTANRRVDERRLERNGETWVDLSLEISGAPKGRIRIEDLLPPELEPVGGAAAVFSGIDGDLTLKMRYRIRCPRGRYRIGPLKITLWNHYGLEKREFLIEPDETDEIVVFPAAKQIGEFPINVRKTLVYAGLNPSGRGGDGVHFHDIREYRTGDSLRHIHWPAVARHDEQLFTREFEQERVSDIGIIVDARSESYGQYGEDMAIESSVDAATALSDVLLGLQNRVGLMIYGNTLNWTVPGYGKIQSERIKRALSSLETGSHEVFKSLDKLPTNLFPEKSQLIFISPLQSEDGEFLKKLRGRGYGIVAIVPDLLQSCSEFHDTLAVELVRLERDRMIMELEHSGIAVLLWDRSDSLEKLIQVNRGKLRMAARGQL